MLMAKPISALDEPLSEMEVRQAKRAFRNSDLYKELTALGCPIEELEGIPSNARRFLNISRDFMNPNDKWNYSIIGSEIYDYKAGKAGFKQNNRAEGAMRRIKRDANKLVAFFKSGGHEARNFWMERGLAEWEESKGRTEPKGMAETLNRFCNPQIEKQFNEKAIYDALVSVLDRWSKSISGAVMSEFNDIESWIGNMNWNKNSGWPYQMPISEERFRSVDLPNFLSWLTALTKADAIEQLERHMETAPGNVPNANREIDIMFNRKPDRVIWGIRLLLKPIGAYFAHNTTSNMQNSGIAWYDVPTYYSKYAEACAHGDIIIAAEDFKKYDSNIPARFFTLAYEIVKDSDFLKGNPQMRNVLLALLYVLCKPAKLMIHPFFRVEQLRGLRSGHPLTQWLGSWLHLALGERWTEHFGIEWELEEVLSDDAIRGARGITLEEMDRLVFTDLAEDIEQFGLEFNDKKTVVADPFANQIEIGYHTRAERTISVGDATYFLKQMAAPDIAGSAGDSIGAINSIIQSERPATLLQQEEVEPFIIGRDLEKGKSNKGAIMDLTRVVDIVSSTGQGNPLYDETIDFVRTAWPGFDRRAEKILNQQLDQKWREGTVLYANNLDRGITRKLVVEDLLNPEREPLWLDKAFL